MVGCPATAGSHCWVAFSPRGAPDTRSIIDDLGDQGDALRVYPMLNLATLLREQGKVGEALQLAERACLLLEGVWIADGARISGDIAGFC